MPVPQVYFDSLGGLWQMAGHGPFVWSAYAIVFVVIAAIIAHSRARSREALRRVRNRMDAPRQTDTRED